MGRQAISKENFQLPKSFPKILLLYVPYVISLYLSIYDISHRTQMDVFVENSVIAYLFIIYSLYLARLSGLTRKKLFYRVIIVWAVGFIGMILLFVLFGLLVISEGILAPMTLEMPGIPIDYFVLYDSIIISSAALGVLFYVIHKILLADALSFKTLVLHILPVVVLALIIYTTGAQIFLHKYTVDDTDKMIFIFMVLFSSIAHHLYLRFLILKSYRPVSND